MKNIITTAVLTLMISSVFAGGNGQANSLFGNRNTPAPNSRVVVHHRNAMPQRNVYIQPAPVHCATPVQQWGPVAMNPYSFNQLMQTIGNANFENTKLNIFRQAMAYNYFTSQQVLQVMDQFCFDSYKLDVAKMAYNKTVDPGNYYIVNNGFTFNSSVNQLGDYLAMR